jgi:hypothetical protein
MTTAVMLAVSRHRTAGACRIMIILRFLRRINRARSPELAALARGGLSMRRDEARPLSEHGCLRPIASAQFG